MSLQQKCWLLVGMGVAAGVIEAFWDNPHAKFFAYIRNIVIAVLPSMVAARFLRKGGS